MTAPVEITRLVRRGLRITGSFGARPRTDMPLLLALVERGVVEPTGAITRRFPLEQAAEAYAALDRREIVGRAILTTGLYSADPGGRLRWRRVDRRHRLRREDAVRALWRRARRRARDGARGDRDPRRARARRRRPGGGRLRRHGAGAPGGGRAGARAPGGDRGGHPEG